MPHDIYTETPLLPHLIAERVADHGDEDMVKYLTERAERHYRESKHFRKEINNKRKDPREYLIMFMNHWKKAKRAFDIRNTKDTIYFQTAWSSPIKLIQQLSKMFPLVKIELSYADEDSGSNTGIILFENGEALEVTQPESGSKEGYDIYFNLNPGSIDNYKLVDGNYVYVDED